LKATLRDQGRGRATMRSLASIAVAHRALRSLGNFAREPSAASDIQRLLKETYSLMDRDVLKCQADV
jgi:hypothetical protein